MHTPAQGAMRRALDDLEYLDESPQENLDLPDPPTSKKKRQQGKKKSKDTDTEGDNDTDEPGPSKKKRQQPKRKSKDTDSEGDTDTDEPGPSKKKRQQPRRKSERSERSDRWMQKHKEKSSVKKRKSVDEHSNTSDSMDEPSPRPSSSGKKLKKTTRLEIIKHDTSSNESSDESDDGSRPDDVKLSPFLRGMAEQLRIGLPKNNANVGSRLKQMEAKTKRVPKASFFCKDLSVWQRVSITHRLATNGCSSRT